VATLAYLTLTTNTPLTVIVGRMDEGMSSLVLLSVPLFVFLGLLIEMTGVAKAMVDFLASLLGHVRGGLAYVLLGAMYLVSGISGSKAADMAAVAPALFPEMKRRGADDGRLIAQPGADHHRLGDRRVDCGALYWRPAAGAGRRSGAGRRGVFS
jgi:TRAP-type mannitol/chloroaromatic compound transport system permease large subunit